MNCVCTELLSPDYQQRRWSGEDCRVWLARIDRIYREIGSDNRPTITIARQILFDKNARVSRREQVLIALIDHRDRRACALLDECAARLGNRKLDFIRHIAQKRRRRRLSSATAQPLAA